MKKRKSDKQEGNTDYQKKGSSDFFTHQVCFDYELFLITHQIIHTY